MEWGGGVLFYLGLSLQRPLVPGGPWAVGGQQGRSRSHVHLTLWLPPVTAGSWSQILIIGRTTAGGQWGRKAAFVTQEIRGSISCLFCQ